MAFCLSLLLPLALLMGTGCASIKTNIHYEQALKAFEENRFEEAESNLRSALVHSPGDENTLSLLGWVCFKSNRFDAAEGHFEKTLLANPQNISAIEGLAWIDLKKGRNETSEEKFLKMSRFAEKHILNPFWSEYSFKDRQYIFSIHSHANYGLGLISKRTGRWKLARKYLEEAMVVPSPYIAPDEVRSHLAETLFRLEEHGQAIPHFEALLSKKEADLFFLNRYAWCLYRTGKFEEAKKLFLASKINYSLEAEFYRGTSTLHNTTQKLRAKNLAEPYYGLALIHAQGKNPVEAQKELLFALSLSPFFHHPDEIVTLFSSYPDWPKRLQPHLIGKNLP